MKRVPFLNSTTNKHSKGAPPIAKNVSVTVGVIGMVPNCGTTHTAIMLVKYLRQLGTAALVELNASGHFAEIERIYDGEAEQNTSSTGFVIDGIQFYKFTDGMMTAGAFNLPERFTVIDFGSFAADEPLDDFLRCHYQLVVADGAEWKIKNIQDFYQAQKNTYKQKWIYLIPLAAAETVKFISKELPNKVFRVPYQADPFEKAAWESGQVFSKVLG